VQLSIAKTGAGGFPAKPIPIGGLAGGFLPRAYLSAQRRIWIPGKKAC